MKRRLLSILLIPALLTLCACPQNQVLSNLQIVLDTLTLAAPTITKYLPQDSALINAAIADAQTGVNAAKAGGPGTTNVIISAVTAVIAKVENQLVAGDVLNIKNVNVQTEILGGLYAANIALHLLVNLLGVQVPASIAQAVLGPRISVIEQFKQTPCWGENFRKGKR